MLILLLEDLLLHLLDGLDGAQVAASCGYARGVDESGRVLAVQTTSLEQLRLHDETLAVCPVGPRCMLLKADLQLSLHERLPSVRLGLLSICYSGRRVLQELLGVSMRIQIRGPH